MDAPYHILTGLRILKKQPKQVKDAVTFYVRTGAWYAHPECLLFSLLASNTMSNREFAIKQIMKLRGNRLRPRITPKLNISATSLNKLLTFYISFICSFSVVPTLRSCKERPDVVSL